MRVSLVVAMSRNRVIGRDGQLPWRLPADLRHFRELTWGHPIIMGRRTHESIGKPLPGRENIVLSRQPNGPDPDTVRMAGSLEEALRLAESSEEVFIIGGREVYELALPRASRIHLTLVDTDSEGDTFFPPLDETEWELRKSTEHPADDRNPHALSFRLYERVRPAP